MSCQNHKVGSFSFHHLCFFFFLFLFISHSSVRNTPIFPGVWCISSLSDLENGEWMKEKNRCYYFYYHTYYSQLTVTIKSRNKAKKTGCCIHTVHTYACILYCVDVYVSMTRRPAFDRVEPQRKSVLFANEVCL